MPLITAQNPRLPGPPVLVAGVVLVILVAVVGGKLGTFALAALAGAAVFSVIHPLAIFPLYFAVLFFNDTTFDGALPISPNQVLAPLFLLSTGMLYLRGKTLSPRFKFLVPLLVMVLYFSVRGVTGENLENGLLYTRYLVIYLVMAVCIAMLMVKESTILKFAWIIVLVTTGFAIHGLVEAFQKNLLTSAIYNWGGAFRVKGTAANSIVFAWNMIYAFPFAFLLFSESHSRVTRTLALLCGLLILSAAILTFNRQSYVQMAIVVTLCMALFTYRNRKALLAMLIGFGGLAGVAVLPLILQRFLTVASLSKDYSFLERRDSFLIGMEMIKSSPIVGIGFGSYSKVWGKYIPAEYNTYFAQYRGAVIPKFMDMGYLSIFAETGIIGLALFVTLLILVLWRAWKFRRAAVAVGDHFSQNFASMVIAVTVFIGLTSMLQDTFLFTRVWIVMGLVLLLDRNVLPISPPLYTDHPHGHASLTGEPAP